MGTFNIQQLLICVVLFSCYHREAALIQSVL